MLPHPLHPAIVHFPVVLAFLLPISALVALWTIRRGTPPARAWVIPLALSAALVLSSWVSVKTGETQEELVERVVPDQALDRHEDAAELFLTLSGVLLLVTGAGLIPGALGRSARVIGTAGAFGLIAAATSVGHSGGELVYRYGAASAYANGAPRVAGAAPTVNEASPLERATDRGDDDGR